MGDGIDFGRMVVKPEKEGDKADPHTFKIKLMNILGNSVTFENPEEFTNEKPWEINHEDLLDMLKIAEDIAKKRGEIISKSIVIEDYVEEGIKTILFGTEVTESSKLFEEFLLSNPSFTFENKRKVLFRLLKNHSILRESDFSKYFSEVEKSILIRNSFAHGKIIFRGKKAFLQYVGKQNHIEHDELNDEYFKNKFAILKNVLLLLSSEVCPVISQTQQKNSKKSQQ